MGDYVADKDRHLFIMDGWRYRHPPESVAKGTSMSIPVTPEELDAIKKAAQQDGLSVSGFARELIRKHAVHAGIFPDEISLEILDDFLEGMEGMPEW